MKREKIWAAVMMFALVATWCSRAAVAQLTGGVKGRVTQNSEPVGNVQVVFTDLEMGHQYKTKTEKDGSFISAGMRLTTYKLEIIGKTNKFFTPIIR